MKEYKFSGDDYKPSRDKGALSNQIERVLAVMSDQKWRSVAQLQNRIQQRFGVIDPENSLQAQLRNLRKVSNGCYEVPRERRETSGKGYYVYKLGKKSTLAKSRQKLSEKTADQLIAIILKQRKEIKALKETSE